MFADNDRISRIQVKCQFALTFLGPAILSICTGIKIQNTLIGIAIGTVFLMIWMFFLLRFSHGFCHMEKSCGKVLSVCIKLLLLFYLVETGGFLAEKTGHLIATYVIPGIRPELAAFLFILFSLAGCQTIQARGRFAQCIWPVIGWSISFLLIVAVVFGTIGMEDIFRLPHITWNRKDFQEIIQQALWMLSVFSGIILLPFLGEQVEQKGETGKNLLWTMSKAGLYLGGIHLLLFFLLGTSVEERESYPMLLAMAGIRLPGGFLRRMDLIFLTILLFSNLFAMGSILFYGKVIGESMKLKKCRLFLGVFCLIAGKIVLSGTEIQDYYPKILQTVFLPLLLGITVCFSFLRRNNRKILAAVLCGCLLLSGCRMIEPENRAYPLVAGIAFDGKEYKVYLSMAQLAQSTGQGKTGEEAQTQENHGILLLVGKNKEEILEYYKERYELYLDTGHIQAVIFEKQLMEDYGKDLISSMEKGQMAGAGASVFVADDVERIFQISQEQGISLGGFLSGIYENRIDEKLPKTMAQVYKRFCEQKKEISLPVLKVEENRIYVDKET